MEKVTHDWRRSYLNAIFKVSWSSFTANDRLSLVFKINLLNNLEACSHACERRCLHKNRKEQPDKDGKGRRPHLMSN